MSYIRWFREITDQDRPLTGSKGAALGELYQVLHDTSTPMPNGFVVTNQAYRDLLEHNGLVPPIRDELDKLDVKDSVMLKASSARLRQWLQQATFPPALEQQLLTAQRQLCRSQDDASHLALRATVNASEPCGTPCIGHKETYLNIYGEDQLLDGCRKVFASLFTGRILCKHLECGCDPVDASVAITIQSMVRADRGSAGLLFTADSESGFREVMEISAAYGLGENVLEGSVIPDRFWIFKRTLNDHTRPVVKRQLGRKGVRLVALDKSRQGATTHNEAVLPEEQNRFCVTDGELLQLARSALKIESYFADRHANQQPLLIEWAKDGLSNKLFMLQASPHPLPLPQPLNRVYRLKSHGTCLLTGLSIGRQIAGGKVRVINDASQLLELRPGEVLVADMTEPGWEPAMSAASAIITNRGERMCHAAVVAHHLGIPAVVGSDGATTRLQSGQEVTVCCAGAGEGQVFDGRPDYEIHNEPANFPRRPHTRIMLNIADPHCAFKQAALPNDGVGLARLEFIIKHMLGLHPAAVLEYEQQPEQVQQEIRERSYGYRNPQHFYVERLAEGIGTIAAAFYPKPVILRFSDFKSNEYRDLVGGDRYEPIEANPMLGFRGAARYPTRQFAGCFALECQAVKRVRNTMGLDNLMLMLPFVRTPEELDEVVQILSDHGLRRGDDGLMLYIMCELPANVVLADEFLAGCDGFSIGSNDLTQLVLGVDRGSSLLGHFDEHNPAVKKMIASAIDSCHHQHKFVAISGRAPSDYPDFTRWLVQQGIDAISFDPASVLEMTGVVLALEEELGRG